MKRTKALGHRVLLLGSLAPFLGGSVVAQTITEFPIPTAASSPIAITAGSDGNLWFAESQAGNIGRISADGVVTEFAVAYFSPRGIAAGADGNLWVTESYFPDAQIVRMTPSGSTTVFPFGNPSCSPHSCPTVGAIAQGPDGNLWFADRPVSLPDALDRITTDGVFLGGARLGSVLAGLASGPDDAMWFTEPIPNRIGRMTTTGVQTEFPIPTAASEPQGIALGADGNLWFAETAVKQIGRITPAGTITEFSSGTGHPRGIGLGADGNLWFTATADAPAGLGIVARITTDGVVTEFPLPTPNADPGAITPGPGGDMWFTEQGANKIGRITTVGPAALNTVAPCRVVDTRDPDGPLGGPALAANTTRTFTLAGHCGIPAGARDVAVNVTVVSPSAPGDLRAYPGGTLLPPASVINYVSGQTRANSTVLHLNHAGELAVHCDQATGSIQFILDVSGYFK